MPQTQFSCCRLTFVTCTFVATNSSVWYSVINWSPHFIRISWVFTYCPFSVPGSPVTTFSHPIILDPSAVMDLPSKPFLAVVVRCFLEGPLSLGLTGFPIIRLGLWGFARKTTEVKCLFHHIVPRVHAVNMTYHWWGSPRPLGTFVRFLCCKVVEDLSVSPSIIHSINCSIIVNHMDTWIFSLYFGL